MGNTESDLSKNEKMSQSDKERIFQQNLLHKKELKIKFFREN